MKIKLSKHHLLIIILLIGFFFRFYNTPARYGFDYDATRDALIAIYGAREMQLPLIGPPTSVGSFTFGPWYYYQLIIFKLLSTFDYAAWISIGFFSFLSIFILYKIGELLGNRWLGLIVAAFVAISPSQVILATTLSNPSSVFLYSVLAIWIFLKVIHTKVSKWWVFLFGLVLGIGVTNHYQMVGYFVLPFIALFFVKKSKLQYIFTFFLGLCVAFMPIFFFDIQNNWHTVRGIVYYILHGTSNPIYVPNSWSIYIRDFWPTFWSYTLGVPNIIGVSVIVCFFFLCLWLLIKRKMSLLLVATLIVFTFNFLYFRYYKGERVIYYLYYLQPFIFIFSSYLLWSIFKFKYGKYIGLLVFVGLCIFIFPSSMMQLRSNEENLIYNKYINQLIENYPTKKFSLYNCGTNQRNRAYGLAFLLDNKQKLSNNGIRIGIADSTCKLEQANAESHAKKKIKINTENRDVVFIALSGSTSQLYTEGWIDVSPENVYNAIIRP